MFLQIGSPESKSPSMWGSMLRPLILVNFTYRWHTTYTTGAHRTDPSQNQRGSHDKGLDAPLTQPPEPTVVAQPCPCEPVSGKLRQSPNTLNLNKSFSLQRALKGLTKDSSAVDPKTAKWHPWSPRWPSKCRRTRGFLALALFPKMPPQVHEPWSELLIA